MSVEFMEVVEVAKANHKWNKKNKHVKECVVCGCVGETEYGITLYSRSGQSFNGLPECVDWDSEDKKTID